tara:strand:+ start:514 stop:1356 length:843 start_codon:yes stop_codon:yes gene_type:complete
MKIIYLLGRGRSGSTLISHVLGSQKDVLNVGELKNFWEYHCREDKMGRKCSDGLNLDNHPFWTKVRNELKSKINNEFPNLKVKNNDEFQNNNSAMFNAINKISGDEIIVDASKKFERLKRLLKVNKNIYTIHVVRDPRAYAFSIMKHNKRALTKNKKPQSVWLKVVTWSIYNLYVKLYLKITGVRHITMTYEDFVDQPKNKLNQVFSFIGKNDSSVNLSFSELQPVFGGNVWFLESKQSEIKKDELYKKILTKKQWIIYTILSFPVLLFYRYPLKRYNND